MIGNPSKIRINSEIVMKSGDNNTSVEHMSAEEVLASAHGKVQFADLKLDGPVRQGVFRARAEGDAILGRGQATQVSRLAVEPAAL